jgi:predicted nucleotidyltransferase
LRFSGDKGIKPLDFWFIYVHNELTMKNRILEKLTRCLAEKQEILFAYVLGTFLTGDDFQDIDVGIFLDEKTMPRIDTLRYELELAVEAEDCIKPGEVFKRYIPIDIKVVNDAPVTFRYSVSKGKLLFSKDENTREEFLCRTWQEYFDFEYILDTYYREVIDAGF